MNDDNIIITSRHISSISYHPAKAVTAGYAAETDSEWKNPYIIYADDCGNAGKNNPKKVEKSVALNCAMLYNTVVRKERDQDF